VLLQAYVYGAVPKLGYAIAIPLLAVHIELSVVTVAIGSGLTVTVLDAEAVHVPIE
jgi:hypothetical protein